MTYSAIGAISPKKNAAGRARGQASTAAYRHALAAGFDRAFLVAAAIAVLTIVVAITTIRLRRADLAGD